MSCTLLPQTLLMLDCTFPCDPKMKYVADVAEHFSCALQILAGAWQSTGWPVVVAIIAHWFGRGKRGLVLGVWNAHTSIGNSLGALLGASVLDYGWAWPYVLLGIFMFFMGILVWAFLVVDPSDVNLPGPDKESADPTDFMDLEDAEDGDTIVHAAQVPQVSASFLTGIALYNISKFWQSSH